MARWMASLGQLSFLAFSTPAKRRAFIVASAPAVVAPGVFRTVWCDWFGCGGGIVALRQWVRAGSARAGADGHQPSAVPRGAGSPAFRVVPRAPGACGLHGRV